MDKMDRKVQQLGSAWDGLPADLLANVLEHLPRDDPGIAAIRQTCRWAQHAMLHSYRSSLHDVQAVYAGLWSAFSEPTGLTSLIVSTWCADEAVDAFYFDAALKQRPVGWFGRFKMEHYA